MTLILPEETENNLISKCKHLIAKHKAALLEVVGSLIHTLYSIAQTVVSNFLLMKHLQHQQIPELKANFSYQSKFKTLYRSYNGELPNYKFKM